MTALAMRAAGRAGNSAPLQRAFAACCRVAMAAGKTASRDNSRCLPRAASAGRHGGESARRQQAQPSPIQGIL